MGSHFFQPDILTPALADAKEADTPTALQDVMLERFSKLEKELVQGKGEMVSQSDIFFTVIAKLRAVVESGRSSWLEMNSRMILRRLLMVSESSLPFRTLMRSC